MSADHQSRVGWELWAGWVLSVQGWVHVRAALLGLSASVMVPKPWSMTSPSFSFGICLRIEKGMEKGM